MNRRDLLKKAIAATPLLAAATMKAGTFCTSNTTCPTATRPLTIHLEGPFIVVLKKSPTTPSQISKVIAFSPIEPQGMHLFKINGVPLSKDKHHHFRLAPEGIIKETIPCIPADFTDFCVEDQDNWDQTDGTRFISLELPCPKRIYTSDIIQVKFKSGTCGNLPIDHILEYELDPLTQPFNMTYIETGDEISSMASEFRFEVGLPRGTTNSLNLAATFYNGPILSRLPSLQIPTRQIDTILPTDCPPAVVQRQKILSRLATQAVSSLSWVDTQSTTTVECKNGGIIITG